YVNARSMAIRRAASVFQDAPFWEGSTGSPSAFIAGLESATATRTTTPNDDDEFRTSTHLAIKPDARTFVELVAMANANPKLSLHNLLNRFFKQAWIATGSSSLSSSRIPARAVFHASGCGGSNIRRATSATTTTTPSTTECGSSSSSSSSSS